MYQASKELLRKWKSQRSNSLSQGLLKLFKKRFKNIVDGILSKLSYLFGPDGFKIFKLKPNKIYWEISLLKKILAKLEKWDKNLYLYNISVDGFDDIREYFFAKWPYLARNHKLMVKKFIVKWKCLLCSKRRIILHRSIFTWGYISWLYKLMWILLHLKLLSQRIQCQIIISHSANVLKNGGMRRSTRR